MNRIKWIVQDDIKHENDDGNVTYSRGMPYEMEMSDSEHRIYVGAGVVAMLVVVASVVGVALV